ncbi:MAG TPA: hypothetical protein VNT25_02390 [Allosphingosinicella sp.]|nr:hypothetical protein [Allosphingosinicella sp.]
MRVKLLLAGAYLLAACACQPAEEAEKVEAKADQLETGAARAPDGAQEEVLENNAEALREAAEEGKKVDTEGSVTVVEE